MNSLRALFLASLPLFGLSITTLGCSDKSSRGPNLGGSILSQRREATSAVLVDSISRTLNRLAREVVTELTPPKPILDDSRSADGQEVLAVLDVTPQVPDGPFNYLSVPAGNANFRTLQVKPGDIVRYFVKYDREDLEHGFENVTFLEMRVRRLDVNNPQNALVVEGGLSGRVEIPHRIEIWRFSDKRMNEIRIRLSRYIDQPREMIGWEPSPDESALQQLVDRLNQWWRNLPTRKQPWQESPLVRELPTEFRAQQPVAELLRPETLREGGFRLWEGRLLQQAIWLRDVSAWAKGEGLSDLEIAAELFDWTVRNIQLDEPDEAVIIHHPWQALMYGHGSAEHRGWVFVELCRQQQLDVVMLAIDRGDGSTQWWLPALLSEGQLYLFDSHLGLPIPGSEAGSVATLAELMVKPELLDQLNVEGADAYSVSSELFQHEGGPRLTAWLVATPFQLSRRAVDLQSVLEGENFVTLAADCGRLVKLLSDNQDVDQIGLWPLPIQSLVDEQNMPRETRLLAAQRFLIFAQRPLLWKARVLHFQGTRDVPFEERNDPLAQADYGHRQATKLYQDDRVRPSERVLNKLEPAKQVIYRWSKADASYWLGLLSYDVGKHQIAVDWLAQRTLGATPNGPWTNGARYNLARSYEALGEIEMAIDWLQADQSPQRHGNLLRARQLSGTVAAASEATESAE